MQYLADDIQLEYNVSALVYYGTRVRVTRGKPSNVNINRSAMLTFYD